ncbi:methyltransferase like 5, putative [Ichthyophthirius multifiliis]|uniref:Methyltransferase-like protein 5 n=1 Tax=Ichthyophthirius multifiliis TaxID=5932 RepID=G0R4W9_ICHMU|nr:methyltransferase like 5, putative [Ichthyophthirius multifiliis]EGR27479.1 methyltransferase like 5, putative [Ichthyophthirius multifiliis]|eukprot:XP_004024389.1 methyltransferase like 5, putative [Ichthyophthirius multifiliis]
MDNFDQGEKDKWILEQHLTPPNIAAQCLTQILDIEEDLETKIIGDFGCGTGMLTAGMIYIGARNVIGFEIDTKYAEISNNGLIEKFEDQSMFDIININLKQWNVKCKIFDIVVMNPPFGTKDEGIDSLFLEKAFQSCNGNVYSMHKSSTRKFLMKKAEQYKYEFILLKQIKFPLPKRFNKYHKKDIGYTDVDFILFKPKK